MMIAGCCNNSRKLRRAILAKRVGMRNDCSGMQRRFYAADYRRRMCLGARRGGRQCIRCMRRQCKISRQQRRFRNCVRATHSLRKKAAFSDSLPRAVADFADSCGEEIARQITAAASRAPERISAVESAILRAAVAELLLPQTPPVNVIINEAVELAKEFGAEGGHKIVNGALDKIAARLQENDSPDDARE